jgi:hypothetical protein
MMWARIRKSVSSRNILLWSTWLLAFQPLTVHAQKISQIEFGAASVPSGTNTIITVLLDVINKPWCGMHVEFGDGQGQDVRVGDDGSADGRVVLQHAYTTPGKYIAIASGKFLGRGLFSALACDGMARSTTLNIFDKAAEELAAERRRQIEEDKQGLVRAEADRALSIKEAELQLKQRELELKEKQLENDRLKFSQDKAKRADADLRRDEVIPNSANGTPQSAQSSEKNRRPMPVLIPKAF